jgi:hypothetical protein
MNDEKTDEMTDEMWACLARSEIGRRFREGGRDDTAIESIGRRFPDAFRVARASTVGVLQERGFVHGSPPVATDQGRSVLATAMGDRGLGRWERKRPCMHPGHAPPSHLLLKEGQRYDHTCPSCGEVTTISGPDGPWLGA